jgi:DNA-binding sugar fermentation-stimulating protein
MSQILLYKLENLIEGTVVKRPSIYIKSPYVADVLITSKEEVLAHTASLGCCGLADVEATILMTISNTNTKKKTKQTNKANKNCTHTVYLSVILEKEKEKEKGQEQIIGIHPKLAENLVESALNKNCLTKLKNIKRYRRETTIHVEHKINSRFDFTGIDENGIPFIMEVKNVPLADYEDLPKAKKTEKRDYSKYEFNSKVAYFPDGYRKQSSDPVSPRALKHIKELTLIKLESNIRCIMCYVIQRTDVNRFQPSIIDPQYREAVKQALESGVEIITLVVSWNREGEAYFIRDDLPITPFN